MTVYIGRTVQERKKSQGTKSIGWRTPEGPCSLPEIETCQGHLNNYHLIVLSVDHNYQIIFKDPFHDVSKYIILMRAYIDGGTQEPITKSLQLS